MNNQHTKLAVLNKFRTEVNAKQFVGYMFFKRIAFTHQQKEQPYFVVCQVSDTLCLSLPYNSGKVVFLMLHYMQCVLKTCQVIQRGFCSPSCELNVETEVIVKQFVGCMFFKFIAFTHQQNEQPYFVVCQDSDTLCLPFSYNSGKVTFSVSVRNNCIRTFYVIYLKLCVRVQQSNKATEMLQSLYIVYIGYYFVFLESYIA